jgi:class 3 adenylate cyclase
MVGEPVVLAFRIEKLAGPTTGSIIVCPRTHEMAAASFTFRTLGQRQIKGLDGDYALYSLSGSLVTP